MYRRRKNSASTLLLAALGVLWQLPVAVGTGLDASNSSASTRPTLADTNISGGGANCSDGPRIKVLQIGANDFDYKHANDWLQKWLVDEWQKPPGIEAVLVEPNPHIFNVLSNATREIFGASISKQIRLLNCAVCPNHSGTVTFWGVSPQFAIDYPGRGHWQKFQVSSLNRQHLYKHQIREKYHEPINVSCFTPGDLLALAGYDAQDVDILYVDAEGFDGQILSAFFQIPTFLPAVIKFECRHLSGGCLRGPEIFGLLSQLKNRSYIVEDLGLDSDRLARISRLEHVERREKGGVELFRAACKSTVAAMEPKSQDGQIEPAFETVESVPVDIADSSKFTDMVPLQIAQLQTTGVFPLAIGGISLCVSAIFVTKACGRCCHKCLEGASSR